MNWRTCVMAFTALIGSNNAYGSVDKIIDQMTLEEKIDYIGGHKTFYVRAIDHLGVPEIKMADGPLGVRNYGPSTGYPAAIALAASWDVNLATRYGSMLGKDA